MPTKKVELNEPELDDEEFKDDELAEEDVEAPLGEEASAEEEVAEEEPVEEFDEVAREASRMTADVPVQVVAVMGKKTISMKELINMKMGQVIDLARPVNETIDLVAGGKMVAKGELVDIDGKLGVRIVKMVR